MSLSVRAATQADIPVLARMNKRLFEDAGSQNPMSVEALGERFAGWLAAAEWTVVLFSLADTDVGYAAFSSRPDLYEPEIPFIYVRQFYIDRAWRRRGVGRAAFAALTRARFPARCKITIDTLATDTNAPAFWSALGFAPYSMTMMLQYQAESP
jgi:GNAT superfamily N-acetyltransferase